MDYKVRRLIPGDERLALQVVRDVMPFDERQGREPGLQHLGRLLQQDTNYLIVALAGEAPVGFLMAYRMPALDCDATMVYLFEIEVALAHRRKGLGRQMITLLKALCREDGVEDMWVGTENTNIAARKLYESTGGSLESSDNCEFIYLLKSGGEIS